MILDLTAPESPSSILALVTTVHLAAAALRHHRRPRGGSVWALSVISLLLAGLPWILPSGTGLAAGLVAHAAWFAVCERFGPRAPAPHVAPQPTAAVEAAPRTARAPTGRVLAQFTPLPILAVLDETPSIKTIRLHRPEGFDFEPGQFVTVRVRLDGKEHARCYSISSSPDWRGYFEISIRRQGVVSNALHALARQGAMLSVKGPLGSFKYPADDDRPMVLLAGGIGITPLISMARHAAATAPARPVTLLYCAHSDADFAFRDELAWLAARHPQLRVQLAASKGPAGASVYPGRIDEALLTATVPDLPRSVCLICGPGPMIDGLRTLLGRLGVPSDQIRFEVFNAAVAAANEAPAKPAAARTAAVFQMTCAHAGRRVRIASGQTLLEAAEDARIPMESLCRAGVCGTCRVQVAGGDVRCETDTLGAAEKAEGFVLACVATAASDCTVNV